MDRRLANALLAAFLLWAMMFSPWTASQIQFSGAMIASCILLTVVALWFSHRDEHVHPLIEYARSLSIAGRWVHMAVGIPLIAALAIFCPRGLLFAGIGVAEEIFWRGYIQRTFADYYADGLRIRNLLLPSRQAAYVLTTLLYTGVYLASTHLPLIGVALVGGWIFGGIYYRFPSSYPALVLAHAIAGILAGFIF